MNQPKNSRKNAEVDTSKTTPEDNPFSTIVKLHPKLIHFTP
ncbi:hypothetical protein [Vibrio sp. J1-1]|nr:hypothetical protein [Vibrio sp. J1-1]